MSSAPPTRTQVVATVGPTSRDPVVLRRIIEAGAGVLRLNLSHGALDEHLETVSEIRRLETAVGVPIAVMADLPGPKIRVARATSFELAEGAIVDLVERDAIHRSDEIVIGIDVDDVLPAISVGHRVLLDDGNVRLLAVEIGGTESGGPRVRCTVTSGGTIRTRVGVNVPDSDPDLPAVTPRDLEFARAMCQAGVDLLAVSFVRDGDDLRRLREALLATDSDASMPGLVSKIERPAAITALEDVIEASDAVLVARGDLGVELDIAEVPVAQKRIVAASIKAGRPVIVATQMLQSMIEQASPTRAEATDVANAVLDGADALMLSGETAIGRHPTLAVETLRRIARRTEAWHHEVAVEDLGSRPTPPLEDPWLSAIAGGVHRIAVELPIRAVAAWAEGTHTARILSRGDLRVPLVVFTDKVLVARRMRLLRGVHPLLVEPASTMPGERQAFLVQAGRRMIEAGMVAAGDTAIFVHGSGRESARPTDALGVFTIADPGASSHG